MNRQDKIPINTNNVNSIRKNIGIFVEHMCIFGGKYYIFSVIDIFSNICAFNLIFFAIFFHCITFFSH